YTAKLLSQGIEKCAKKVGEEAIEAALAAVKGDREHLKLEAADLFYHLIVLLEVSGLPLGEVMGELEKRVGVSGIVEKASRKEVGTDGFAARQNIPLPPFRAQRLGEVACRHADDPRPGGYRRASRPQ